MQSAAMIQKLLKAIRCPITKESLVYVPSENLLKSEKTGIKYEIRDGIPQFTHRTISL